MIRKILILVFILPILAASIYVGFSTHSSKEKKIEYAGLERKYRIHYPKNYVVGKEYPLVVAIHGFMDDARIMEIYTGFSRKADEEGFIVVYPYAYRRGFFSAPSWNSTFCCAWAYDHNVDDLGFLKEMIKQVIGQGGINESRIYVAGISNGAMIGSLLALDMNDKVAGFAQVAGAVGAKYEDDEEFKMLSKSGVPIPTIIIHGKNDEVVPFEGGLSKYRVVNFTGAYDSLFFWLENNKCTNHPSEVSNQQYITKEIYRDCENSNIEFYVTESAHTWPGSIDDLFNFVSKRTINTTDVIWDFFSRN